MAELASNARLPSWQIMNLPNEMLAARLHGPCDMRVETVSTPQLPGPEQVLLRVCATGICGSDLHSYKDARIGDTVVQAPLVLGHEFSGVVLAAGPGALNGNFDPIVTGSHVAVDPAQPCGRCEFCEKGHPNLCRRLHFCGNYPDGGSFCEYLLMPARSCFPVPHAFSEIEAALLEPLGVALHAVDLAKIRVGHSVAIGGAGPIGLLILQLARMAGADPVFITDKLDWRLRAAKELGGVPIDAERESTVGRIERETSGRGVDVAIEAAWGEETVAEAAEWARLGGRVVLVGIPSNDQVQMKHSTARRKGLTILMSRRMKHAYPRAISLVEKGRVDLEKLVSHRFALRETDRGFKMNFAYESDVMKAIVESSPWD